MKNNLLKYYIVAIYLCSTLVMFAADATPGDTDGTVGGLDGGDTPAPIDDYLVVLAIVGIILAFMQFRAIKAKQIRRQNRIY